MATFEEWAKYPDNVGGGGELETSDKIVIGDENAGIIIHRQSEDTKEGVPVAASDWVEIYGDQIHYSRILGPGSFPSSAIHRWRYDEGSGSTAADSIGNWDGYLNGPSRVSGNWVGGEALDGDGSSDYVDYGSSSRSFGSILDSDFALLATIKTSSESGVWFGSRDGGNMNLLWGMDRVDAGDGQVEFQLRSEDDTDGVLYTDKRFDDNSKYRVVFNKKTNDASNWEMWINETKQSVTLSRDNFSGNVADFNQNLYSHAENDSGSDTSHFPGVLDDLIFTDDSLTSQEILDDYSNQPWA